MRFLRIGRVDSQPDRAFVHEYDSVFSPAALAAAACTPDGPHWSEAWHLTFPIEREEVLCFTHERVSRESLNKAIIVLSNASYGLQTAITQFSDKRDKMQVTLKNVGDAWNLLSKYSHNQKITAIEGGFKIIDKEFLFEK